MYKIDLENQIEEKKFILLKYEISGRNIASRKITY